MEPTPRSSYGRSQVHLRLAGWEGPQASTCRQLLLQASPLSPCPAVLAVWRVGGGGGGRQAAHQGRGAALRALGRGQRVLECTAGEGLRQVSARALPPPACPQLPCILEKTETIQGRFCKKKKKKSYTTEGQLWTKLGSKFEEIMHVAIAIFCQMHRNTHSTDHAGLEDFYFLGRSCYIFVS